MKLLLRRILGSQFAPTLRGSQEAKAVRQTNDPIPATEQRLAVAKDQLQTKRIARGFIADTKESQHGIRK